jgi:undecaprenyl pyrophosphate phosphatase UppP
VSKRCNPPAIAQSLVAACAPTGDYEIVAGDLQEEYLRVVSLRGAKAANRWYWAQTLRSMPSLLSYSKSNTSAARRIGVALTALGVLVAMIVAVTVIDSLLSGMGRALIWVFFLLNWLAAVAFGAILARLVRNDGVRVAFCAALFLVLCFVTPALAGNPHSQAPLLAWILLWGVIPAMCIGAGLYQAARSKTIA